MAWDICRLRRVKRNNKEYIVLQLPGELVELWRELYGDVELVQVEWTAGGIATIVPLRGEVKEKYYVVTP